MSTFAFWFSDYLLLACTICTISDHIKHQETSSEARLSFSRQAYNIKTALRKPAIRFEAVLYLVEEQYISISSQYSS
jgi:hypothetical protein